MSKTALVWVVIRVCGLLLLGRTCLLVCELLLRLAAVYNLFTAAALVGSSPSGQAYQLWFVPVLLLLQAVVYGLLAWYFLRKGTGLHRLLMREGSERGPLADPDASRVQLLR